MTATIDIFQCLVHPGTRLEELRNKMLDVFVRYYPGHINYANRILHQNNILSGSYRWKAKIASYDRSGDPICLLSIEIDDDEKAVLFKMFYDFDTPINKG